MKWKIDPEVMEQAKREVEIRRAAARPKTYKRRKGYKRRKFPDSAVIAP